MDEQPQGHLVYNSLAQLYMDFSRHEAISMVVCTVDQGEYDFYCCARGGGIKQAVQFRVKEGGESTYKYGLHYHEFEVVEQNDVIDWDEITPTKYSLLLPLMINPSPDDPHLFAMITDDWKCMGESSNDLVFPHTYLLDKELAHWRK